MNENLIRDQLLPEFISVCEQFGITIDLITSKLKTPSIHKKRMEVWEELRKRGWSSTEIGICSQRKHSSILRAIKIKLGENNDC